VHSVHVSSGVFGIVTKMYHNQFYWVIRVGNGQALAESSWKCDRLAKAASALRSRYHASLRNWQSIQGQYPKDASGRSFFHWAKRQIRLSDILTSNGRKPVRQYAEVVCRINVPLLNAGWVLLIESERATNNKPSNGSWCLNFEGQESERQFGFQWRGNFDPAPSSVS